MRRLTSAAGLAVVLTGPAYAATWDAGAAPDLNWSNGLNWDGDVAPGVGETALFNDQPLGQTIDLTNVVDTDFTIGTLNYGFRGTASVSSFNHLTEIGAGRTLTLTSALRFLDGGDGTNAANVNVTIRGGDAQSKLVVGAGGTSTVAVFTNNDDVSTFQNALTARINLAGLTSFQFDGGAFGVADQGRGTDLVVTLATNNNLRGTTLTLGSAGGSGGGRSAVLLLGQSNVVQMDTIYVGRRKQDGGATLRFSDAFADGALRVRNRAGGGRAALRIGDNDTGTGSSSFGNANLTGGTVDLLLSDLVLGRKAGNGGGDGNGALTLAKGIIDAQNVRLGETTSATVSGGNSFGTLTVQGGTLIANAVLLANQSPSGTGVAGATLNFSGGVMTVGTVTKGAGTATVNWTGGTLSVGSYGLSLTQNGASSAFSPGGAGANGTSGVSGDYVLTSGSWLVDVAGDGTGDAVAVAGLLDLGGANDSLVVNLRGGDATGNVFVIATYGSLNGVFDNVDLSELPAGATVDYAYNGNSIAVLVPEPGALALLGLAGVSLLGRRRRR